MAKTIKSNKKRRYCKVANCKRLLSIYNLSSYCHVHEHIALTKQVLATSPA